MGARSARRERVLTSPRGHRLVPAFPDPRAVPPSRLTDVSAKGAKATSPVSGGWGHDRESDPSTVTSPSAAAADAGSRFSAREAMSLRTLLASLPPETRLPAGWLLERLPSEHTASRQSFRVELLSAEEFGSRRVPKRSADWVREQCVAGVFTGAYKEGGKWVIPSTELTPRPAPRDHAVSDDRDVSHLGDREASGGARARAARGNHPRW
jgi:hypothetical protein